MGAKDSKPFCISYEDAIKRVSENELRRLRDAFKRSTGSNGTILTKSAFVQDILTDCVPPVLADWLYNACGGTQKGISFKDLICGLVLLTRGSQEEKIRFLWNLYCNDSGCIMKTDFVRALQTETTCEFRVPINSNTNQNAADTQKLLIYYLFVSSDRVNFEQFRSWILKYNDATVLSKWLLQGSFVNISNELDTPTFYQSLAGVTHLEETDICDLEKVFWQHKGSASTEQLDLESFGALISPPVPPQILNGVFLAFDENRDGHIDFKELCCGISAACRGPSTERSKFCFKVFDVNRSGVLAYDDIIDMLSVFLTIANESCDAVTYKDLTIDNILVELIGYVKSIRNPLNSKNSNDKSTLENGDSSDTSLTSIEHFTITQEEFLMWSIHNSQKVNIVQPFMDLLYELCHIVLGLRPQCKHLEHDIVKGWLNREVQRGYSVGHFWYLISEDWWQQWLQYTQYHSSSSPCVSCKAAPNYMNIKLVGIDEALVCDENYQNSTEYIGDLMFTADSSSLGSASSGISCGRNFNGQPGQIDNSNLISPPLYKDTQTLTGEGGRLRKDIILVQHKDYELVPESLWKALSQWYRGQIALPRQVIQPPNAPEVELELYPLNLRILRHQVVAPQNVHSTPNAWGVSGGYGALPPPGNYGTIQSMPQAPKRYLAYTAAFSRLASVRQVIEFLCQRLKLKAEDVRLWHIMNDSSADIKLGTGMENTCLLEEENMMLQDLFINDNDQILLETRNKDLTWPEELGSLTLSTPNSNSTHERRHTVVSMQSTHPPGATGLHNLGNTCFMNAALQVLFNTQPLAQYFHQDMHRYELNTTNKLGKKGLLALRYAETLKDVWTAPARSIAPLKLRFCITKFAPQFAGGGQHDSQELLQWLLDGLHEDLNRVTEKPYSELKDSDGRADEIVATEAWAQHHSRNQSIVIDLFYGQLKSKVSCSGCGKDSVRFDPFSLLSLPLPLENYVYCEVIVILLNGTVPVKYGVRINSESRYDHLKRELSLLCNLEPELMLVCELSNSQIRNILSDSIQVKKSTANDLIVYELPRDTDVNRERSNSELSANIEKGLKDIQRNPVFLPHNLEQNQLTTSSLSTIATNSSFDDSPNVNNMTQPLTIKSPNIELIGNDVVRDTADPAKVSLASRCFGNTICMPQSLLCFKQSIEISTSPESTFQLNNDHVNRNLSNADISLEQNKEITLTEGPRSNSCSCSNGSMNCGNCSLNEDSRLSDQRDVKRVVAGTYLTGVHRKMSRQDVYFLSYHKTRPNLFGIPLIIPCYLNGTNKDLYCAVWRQVARFLSPLPVTSPEQANHATDCDDSLGYEFPFILRTVVGGGNVCALCPWTNFCRGCEIPCNDEPLLRGTITTGCNLSTPKMRNSSSRTQIIVSNHFEHVNVASFLNRGTDLNLSAINIAIDWDPTALHLRYQSTRERNWTDHESLLECRKQQVEPVDLDHCLRAFTSEEKLEEWYHCAHCKGKKPATKKLQIWKLPPVLIVHLKRFNYVNNKWVKSLKTVNFPFDEFDPTPYLASVPQETILRHKELLGSGDGSVDDSHDYYHPVGTQLNDIESDSVSSTSTDNPTDEIKMTATNETPNSSDKTPIVMNGRKMSTTNPPQRRISTTLEKRKRLVSTSLTKTPIVDGQFIDFHNHHLNSNQDPFDLKYRLYAVVSHSGMLNGGHYISYACNANGTWYCYNDSSCREIPNRPNIDPSSAYLLFYERQGLDYGPYLPKVDKTIPNMIPTEMDDQDDLSKKCVIS